jgi:NAD(P)-dependent dehydrogenase (short-subunit alcohol dehydrogenase family)
MAGQLKGKVAVVTGASRGIGRATALALAREEAHVVVTARTRPDLEELAREIQSLGVQGLAVPADVSQEEDVERLREKTLSAFDQVNILVNNAGVGKLGDQGLLHLLSVQDYDWMMDTNMRSSFLCTKAFLPEMLERQDGWIVFVASVAGLKGLGNHQTVYCASKFAQVGFAQALDYEVRESGIKVSVIAPGGVKTDFAIGTGRTAGAPRLDEFMAPDDIADAVVFAVTQPPNVRVFLIGMRPMIEPL